MLEQSFRKSVVMLYPELGGALPDPEKHADSIIIRGLNADSAEIRTLLLEFYGEERVKAAARDRADRLNAPVYRALRNDYDLPGRSAVVERMHALWRP